MKTIKDFGYAKLGNGTYEKKIYEKKEVSNVIVYNPKNNTLKYEFKNNWDDTKKNITNDLQKEAKDLASINVRVKKLIGPKKIEIKLSDKKQEPVDLFDVPFEHKDIVKNNIKLSSTKVVLTKTLRDYQRNATDFAVKHRHSIIELPTGRGKTLVAISIIKELTKREKKKVLVLVPTTVLLEQWINNGFKESSLSAGRVFAKERLWSQYTVSTYQSAYRHAENIPQYDIVIFDEVHHLFAPRYEDILRILVENNWNKRYVIGLTATVRELGNEKYIQDKYFPDKFTKLMSDFQKGSSRIPLQIFKEPVKLNEEETETYYRDMRTIGFATAKLGSIVQWVKYVNDENKNTERLARAAISAYARQKRKLSETPQKKNKILKILRESSGQFIIFIDTVKGMKVLKDFLGQHGIKSDVINAKVSMAERKVILDNLLKGKTRVLIGGNAISEGLDVPNLDNIILSSLFVKSTRSYVQRLGRVLRPIKGKRVKVYIVYAKDTIEEKNMKVVHDILGEKV